MGGFALKNNFSLQAARPPGRGFARQNAKPTKWNMRQISRSPTKRFQRRRLTGYQTGTGWNTAGLRPRGNQDVAISLEMPLYSGGAISAKRRQTAQEYNAARENLINLTRNTVTTTRSPHMTVISDVAGRSAQEEHRVIPERPGRHPGG